MVEANFTKEMEIVVFQMHKEHDAKLQSLRKEVQDNRERCDRLTKRADDADAQMQKFKDQLKQLHQVSKQDLNRLRNERDRLWSHVKDLHLRLETSHEKSMLQSSQHERDFDKVKSQNQELQKKNAKLEEEVTKRKEVDAQQRWHIRKQADMINDLKDELWFKGRELAKCRAYCEKMYRTLKRERKDLLHYRQEVISLQSWNDRKSTTMNRYTAPEGKEKSGKDLEENGNVDRKKANQRNCFKIWVKELKQLEHMTEEIDEQPREELTEKPSQKWMQKLPENDVNPQVQGRRASRIEQISTEPKATTSASLCNEKLNQDTASPSQETASISQETVIQFQKTASASPETASASPETAPAFQEAAFPLQVTALVSQETASPSQETALTSQETTSTSQETVIQLQKTASPSQATASLSSTPSASPKQSRKKNVRFCLPAVCVTKKSKRQKSGCSVS